MDSIDPRVQRLPKVGQPGVLQPKAPLDQFGTFEVFVQPREGKPFQHEGSVHAPDLELAWVLAKETFTRRFTCVSLYVADTRHVRVSPFTEGGVSAYDVLPATKDSEGPKESFEVYHLLKRGKQHVHAGTLQATGPEDAMAQAKNAFGNVPTVNIWIIRTADIRFTRPDEMTLWSTLPEKKFRDASAYKGGDRLTELRERLKKAQDNSTL